MPQNESSKPPRQKLMLTTTSLRNVVLANKSDVIYYEVITPKWARDRTTISRLDPNTRQFDVIGEMKNDGDGKAEEVRLYGGAGVSAHRFLEGGLEPDTAGMKRAAFIGKDGKKYTWRANRRQLELVREDMSEDEPVAVYHREKRHAAMLRMSRHPYLEVDPAAMDTLDSLIVSFLLIERRRRDGRL
ncbi:uncharacterized protein PHACADRAFT_257139 [Phanerochaete carnosa HHB-10118-sp]|uniref:DUF6593 domain-containing protein n=1 Tax=Phanerochaete carnosa (strain HHB-10118-sp) TaxID=650164 RepID=K5VWY4_PHACS|nr:uncharacterized protein PHACADRAFT_257139 [Phanerochaete carnosa HHB-10118-sp]EKM56078.1 hypothetical protein PHACADRAFT_257139 [Phanerochaete carnosa HHB-10118-sp]